MNKKGMIVQIVGGILVILMLVYLSYVVQNTPKEKSQCISQCELKDLNFSSYSGGGYRNNMCNCLNKTSGEIKTIYSK
jgi:hypothetical protein